MTRELRNAMQLGAICLLLALGLIWVASTGSESLTSDLQIMMRLGLICIAFLLLLTWVTSKWVGFSRRLLNLRFWFALFVVFTAIALVMAVYHDIALSHRHVLTNGVSVERVGADRAAFVERAKYIFYIICISLLGFTVVTSIWVGWRNGTRDWLVSAAFIIAASALFIVVLPFIEHNNACAVGTTFLINENCR